jgi:inner membrane protein
MMGITHVAAGALAGAAIAHLTGGNPSLCMSVGALAGLLPDIDSPGSTIGRRIWPVSAFVKATTRHRGVTHTVWFCLAAAICLSTLSPVAGVYAMRYFHLNACPATWLVGMLVLSGALTHLVLDACTPSGIRPLAPISFHPRGSVRTGGLLELPLMLIFLLACLKAARVF